jgi:hypothetical protein
MGLTAWLVGDPVVLTGEGSLETEAMLQQPLVLRQLIVTSVLYLPLGLLFWHAPALVHWHGVSPLKSLFFSLVACLRNFRAFVVFGLTWLALLILAVASVTLAGALLGNPLVSNILFPLLLLMTAMFFTSLYFTFRATFEPPP